MLVTLVRVRVVVVMDLRQFTCLAHTLELAINDGFKNVNMNRVVAASSRLVSHFYHSTVISNALIRKQEQKDLPQHKLIQYCRTRWNSIYTMMERLHEQRVASRTSCASLKSLKCGTTALCSETHVGLSMVLPVIKSLLEKHLEPMEGESKQVADFKRTVADSLSHCARPRRHGGGRQ